MTDRYILHLAQSAEGTRLAWDQGLIRSWPVLDLAHGARLWHAPEARILAWPRGCVIGALFDRGGRAPLDKLTPGDTALIDSSGGAALTDRFWGCYVAVLTDGAGGVSVVRAPFGDLPCLWYRGRDRITVASDPDLLATCGIGTAPSPDRIARYLGRPDYIGEPTCLADIDEVRGGDVLRIPPVGTPRTEHLWSPWTFATDRRAALTDPREARSRLGDAVRTSVAARSAPHARSILLLSGGIDSSVVAASLAAAGHDFSCLNFVSSNAGDETQYARSVAEACGAPLAIAERDPAGVDLTRSATAGQPRPVTRSFLQESVRLALAAAKRTGASAIIDGGGGDNVFYAYLSAAPAAEQWTRNGWSPQFRSTVAALSTLSGVSRLRTTVRAIARAHRGSEAHRPPLLDFLSRDARDHIADDARHPWLVVPRGVGPGTASYVSMLPPVQGLVETQDPRPEIGSIAALVSQPIIETCLRIPSWMWFESWNSRAVVRHAFAGALPRTIIERRSKGTPESFVAAIFEARRAQIEAMLLDGALADMGLIDRDAIAAALAANAVTRGYDFNRILRLVDVEAWMRSWSCSRRG